MDMIMRIMTRKTMTMQIHDHDTEDHDHADDDHAYEIEYDEHIWTSPVNAMKITQVIADTLEEMDPADAAVFRANEADYPREAEESRPGIPGCRGRCGS